MTCNQLLQMKNESDNDPNARKQTNQKRTDIILINKNLRQSVNAGTRMSERLGIRTNGTIENYDRPCIIKRNCF